MDIFSIPKLNTWTEEHQYTEDMLLRGIEMLNMLNIDQYSSVMDVGCGNQQLYSQIMRKNPNIIYYGVDRLAHHPSTIIRDFNENEFFDQQVDLCILSGVLEYIYPSVLHDFMCRVCNSCHTIVASYHFYDFLRYDNKKGDSRWVSKTTLAEMIALLNENRFYLDKFIYFSLKKDVLPRQAIFTAIKKTPVL